MNVITLARTQSNARTRFVTDIIKMHEGLRFNGLPEAIIGDPLHKHDAGDGLLTVAIRDSQLPTRYLKGILGFRLAQYLRLGWISPEVVYNSAMFHEPESSLSGVEDVHIVSLVRSTGRIIGYVGLAGSQDPIPHPLDALDRHLLATEAAHRINLLRNYAAPGWNTHHVFEVKRFLRDQAMPRGRDATLVPWHIILAFGHTLLALKSEHRKILVAGDAKEQVALRHLKLMGLHLDVVDGTKPALPTTELMWPIYQQKVIAKPFVARIPSDFEDLIDVIESYLAAPDPEPAKKIVSQLLERLKTNQKGRAA